VDLAASPDGAAALVRLEDGRTYDLQLAPLRLVPGVPATAVAWLGTHRAIEVPPPALAETTLPEREATAPAPEVREPLTPTGEVAPTPSPSPRSVHGEVEAVPVAPSRGEADSIGPEPERAETRQTSAPPEPGRGQVSGRITGPALGSVVAVVLLGPDSIVRQAARVVPEADGSWLARDLAPGRYRVLLDGGGQRVVVTSPPYLQVEVQGGARVSAPAVEALRAVDR
jgi:hypothetical protein